MCEWVDRTRCYTWHAGLEDDEPTTVTSADLSLLRGGLGVKRPARRNAWGAASYADLIAAAIESSPDKRLTLSQIYDWMVSNVQYFSERADNNSSAGWKVTGFCVLVDSNTTNVMLVILFDVRFRVRVRCPLGFN